MRNIIYFLVYMVPAGALCNTLKKNQPYQISPVQDVSTSPQPNAHYPAPVVTLENANQQNFTHYPKEERKNASDLHQHLPMQKDMIIQSILSPKAQEKSLEQPLSPQESAKVWRSIVDDILKNNNFIALKPERWVDYMRVLLMAPFSTIDRKNLHLPIPKKHDDIFEEWDNEYCLEHKTSSCLLKNTSPLSNTHVAETITRPGVLPEHAPLNLESHTFMNGEDLSCLEGWIMLLLTQSVPSGINPKTLLLSALRTSNPDPSVQRVISNLKASVNASPALTEVYHAFLPSYDQPEKKSINIPEDQRFRLSISAPESAPYSQFNSESLAKFFTPETAQEQQEQLPPSHHKTTTFLKKRGQKHG